MEEVTVTLIEEDTKIEGDSGIEEATQAEAPAEEVLTTGEGMAIEVDMEPEGTIRIGEQDNLASPQ